MKFAINVCLALVLSGGLFGCSTTAGNRDLNTLNHPSDLPIVYHNKQYGFTFFLPASWQSYSVLIQKWNGGDSWHGPIIVLRNPQWKTNNLYQDISVMVFTYNQWDEEKQGRFFPYAGGVISEVWHNNKYVFGLYSRYNADDSVKAWKEANDILQQNCAFHSTPHLYRE